jgi:hypothetical protein
MKQDEGEHPEPKTEKKFTERDHYFWLDRKLIELPKDALSLKALLAYIMYCRHWNPKRDNCTWAGRKNARKHYGLNEQALILANQELISKHFIKHRPEVNTGFYRRGSVHEVLPFPSYTGGAFQCVEGRRDLQTAVRNGGVIAVPSLLVDSNILIGLPPERIKLLLNLYGELDLKNCLGVKHWVVCAGSRNLALGAERYGTRFGGGFNKSITGRDAYEVPWPDDWRPGESIAHGFPEILQALNEFMDSGVIRLVPVVLKTNPHDSGMTEIVREVFKGLVAFNSRSHRDAKNKYMTVLAEGEKVVWVVRPVHLARNQDFLDFTTRADFELAEAKFLYKRYDPTSDTERIVKNPNFLPWLEAQYPSWYDKIPEAYLGKKRALHEWLKDELPAKVFRVYHFRRPEEVRESRVA